VGAYRIAAQFLAMDGRVNPIQAGCIFAQDFPLGFQGQLHPVLLTNIVRQLKGHQLLNLPLGCPDGVITAEQDLVWPYPKEQVRQVVYPNPADNSISAKTG
jgi:hypothetical protein